ncbi:MAG TPA: hypothetical protein VJM13_11460 [Sphingopyxis sp.]|nr:hypothetical protein [Sphingopyxis sp.]
MASMAASHIDATRERLRLGLRPRMVLVAMTGFAMQYSEDPQDRFAVTDRISHSDADGPGQAAWRANTVTVVTALDADPDIRALRQRLFSVGVASAFAAEHDDTGLWTSLVLTAPRTALPALEGLAADDAGILDPSARAEAARAFRTYVLRNHHPHWQANRKLYPDVGDSPYTPRAEWNLLGT